MPQYNPQDFNGTFWTVYDGDYYVSTTGNDITGTGHPGNPFLTVAKAFDLAINGEKIVIGPFEYVAYESLTGSGGGGGTELPCRVATTSNIPLPGGAMTVDGVLLSVGDRVLVWRQSGPAQNGVYVITPTGWERDPNFNNSDNIIGGKLVPVQGGNTHAKSVFQLTTDGTINVGSTHLTFEEVAVADWGEIGGTLTDQTDLSGALNLKADDADLGSHTANTSNPHNVTKGQVGLGSVNNTSDANKPVSTAQQTALDAKADITYVDSQISGLTATIDKATPKGTINASTNPGYPAGELGDYYYVTNAGTIGGDEVEAGDKVQCIADTAAGQAGNWIIFQGNLDIAQNADMETRTDGAKYVTPATSFHGWNHWMANETIAALNTTNKTMVGAINEAAGSGGVENLEDDGVDVKNSASGTGSFIWDSLQLNGSTIETTSMILKIGSSANFYVRAGTDEALQYTGSASLWDFKGKNVQGLGILSISGYINMLNNKIENLADPTNPQDAATKAYVDANDGGAITESGSNIYNSNTSYSGGSSNNTVYGAFALNAMGSVLIGENTAIGALALNSLSVSHSYSTAVGSRALRLALNVRNNSAFGWQAGAGNVDGDESLFIGDGAGYTTALVTNPSSLTQTNCTYVGVRAGTSLNIGNGSTASVTNEIVVGHSVNGNGSNTATWGNALITDHHFSGNININSGKITGVSDPTSPQDVATKAYVDASGGGDVTKVGTPVDNQLAVWTGNGTIQGANRLTYDSGSERFKLDTSSISYFEHASSNSVFERKMSNGTTLETYQTTNGAAANVVQTQFIIPSSNDSGGGGGPALVRWTFGEDTSTNVIENKDLWRVNNGNQTIFDVLANGNWNFYGNDITNVGTGTANTNWVIASDERLKTQVDELPDALTIVRNLQGHRFERKDLNDGVTRIGFMAQEVNDHLPEVVVNDQDNWFMDYSSMTALHNEAIKSVDSEVVELKEKLEKLESILSKHGITF